ncbi:MAG TPA: DNA mismatch repair protein MutL, partial [Acholeplasma sp.]|nr:DNA mismatch repair protein MutL [Acholeplasma sp.]
MNQIKIMDQALSNLIAAGEVVERPASVIKELMENALDAHATYIKVEVKGFGLEQIIVTDNGIGMDKENMKLAILPHATSKIYTKDDLLSVKTLG